MSKNTVKARVVSKQSEIPGYRTWYSLDRALGGSMPYRGIIEISGWPGNGKSSVAQALAGMAKRDGKAIFCIFEDYTEKYISKGMSSIGFNGEIDIVPIMEKNKMLTHEQMLNKFLDDFFIKPYTAAVLDSLGAILTAAEMEGGVEEANMGGKARVSKRVIEKLTHFALRKEMDSTIIITNHLHSTMGMKGSETSGGMAIRYRSLVRMRLSAKETLDDETLVVQGTLTRLKFKPQDDTQLEECFWCVITPRHGGFNPGLTSVIECEKYGLCARENGVIKVGKKTYGRLNQMVRKTPDDEIFKDFHAMLKE